MWFVRALADAGHEVTTTFRLPLEGYDEPLRRRRAQLAAELSTPCFGVAFGDDAFLDLLRTGHFDVLAPHGADVTNYKSPDFDAVAALAHNTRRLPAVLEALRDGGGRRVLITGSVFEGGEGAGSQGLPDFSPYGLSKALTARVFGYYCERGRLGLGKFVIPNPFGPYEEPRFTAWLVRNWLDGKAATCNTPAYVRDNIHVSLLARVYAKFVDALPELGFSRVSPSGYAESQGAFALRVAREMEPRLGVACSVQLAEQREFPEPAVRVNTDIPDARALGWSAAAAWDEMARYYREGTSAEGL